MAKLFKWVATVTNPVTGQTGSGSGVAQGGDNYTRQDAERDAERHVRAQVWHADSVEIRVTEA
jgi:hypothetical protein